MKVLTDFHHSSLLRSLNLLFNERLEMDIYRPIGMEWYHEGFWAINDQEDTAKQFLDMEQAYVPADGTPPLNTIFTGNPQDGAFLVLDPGGRSGHAACTLDFFKRHDFDYVIASIPQHVSLYKKLIELYSPGAKLIVQMGNNWNLQHYKGHNVLASIALQPADDVNVHFYHQEFDLDMFSAVKCKPTKKIFSFVNIIQDTGIGWQDYNQLKEALEPKEYQVMAFGGQCPDGNMTGPFELSQAIQAAQFVFHVKPGGDGFGHIIHNAYAMGRPVITRPSHYRGQLAEQLLVPGTFIDLDRYGPYEVVNIIEQLTNDPAELARMGQRAADRFKEVVNYDAEAAAIKTWLQTLI
jgi:hypothetical protein